ncbi:MAG: hypothetical protein IJ509_03770 [Bacilli bacterium]|nr:hypothetical protein [Bacilli bacterium]
MKKKNSKVKKGIFLGIGIILIFLVVGFSYLVLQDLEQENLLKKEIVNVSNKDFLTDSYDIEVVTTGDYAYIEEAVKSYYKELADNIKLIDNYLNNQELFQILSAENLQADGPNFDKSYKILNDAKTNTSMALENIINLCKEETIKNLIDEEKIDSYSYQLYLELMYTEDDLEDMAATGQEMQELSDNLITFLNKVEAMLNFLKTNNGDWYIENSQLYFRNTNLVNQYNNLYDDLNKFVQENFATNNKSEVQQTSTNI